MSKELDETLNFIFAPLPYSVWTYYELFSNKREYYKRQTRSLAYKLLIKNIDYPSRQKDYVSELKNAFNERRDAYILVKNGLSGNPIIKRGLQVIIPYEKLEELTPHMFITWSFFGRTNRERSVNSENYRLDIDHFFFSKEGKNLKKKLLNTFYQLKEILEDPMITSTSLSPEFTLKIFTETSRGIQKNNVLENSDPFSKSTITFDLREIRDLNKALTTLLMYLLIQPGTCFVLETTKNNPIPLLYGNLFGLFSPNYIDETYSYSKLSDKINVEDFPFRERNEWAIYENWIQKFRDKNEFLDESDMRYWKEFQTRRDGRSPEQYIYSRIRELLADYFSDNIAEHGLPLFPNDGINIGDIIERMY